MSDITKIEWATSTWNPWIGCAKVSPGCANCYAETLSRRFGKDVWGEGKPRQRTKDWKKPLRWNADAQVNVDCSPAMIKLIGRKAGQAPRPRIFPSLCDWLDDEVPVEWLTDFLKLIHDTPNLDWLLLTKRPENWKSRLWECLNAGVPQAIHEWLYFWIDGGIPPENVWLGVSVEDQKRADERIPELLKIPAKLRFVSVEPLLGPVDLSLDHRDVSEHNRDGFIHWVIVGGESGPKARQCNMDWIRSIVQQCRAAGAPCFVKQFGSKPRWNPDPNVTSTYEDRVSAFEMKHPKGGDPSEWPEDLRVREFPTTEHGRSSGCGRG